MFIQDEYRFINQTVQGMREAGIDLIFSCANEPALSQLYPDDKLPGVKKITLLTGYVPEKLLTKRVKSYEQRSIDVVYRGRELPAWYGELAQEKANIAKKFSEDNLRLGLGLKCDLAYKEGERIYGKRWVEFIASSKAVLGVESGASVCDFTGEIQTAVENYAKQHPYTDFETMRNKFFPGLDGKVVINVISPRCFEAICLRTLLVLYEGGYSGILKPWRHYVPLKKDHSNILEVVDVIKTPEKAKKIIETAYQEIGCNSQYSYAEMIRLVDDSLDKVYLMRSGAVFGSKEMNSYAFHIVTFFYRVSIRLRYVVISIRSLLLNTVCGRFTKLCRKYKLRGLIK